jgi:SWIM zinc finger
MLRKLAAPVDICQLKPRRGSGAMLTVGQMQSLMYDRRVLIRIARIGQGISAAMAVTIDKIEALAPDQASLSAALKIKPSSWALLSRNEPDGFAWGECQGSGSTPYKVALSVSDLGYKCSCPSRKFPCKHSLGLMLQLAKSAQSFTAAQTADWVHDWAGRRRSGAGGAPGPHKEGAPKASTAGARQAEAEAEDTPDDPLAEARAAKQRERVKEQREAAILAGNAPQLCRIAAQRLVDAKAPSLAASVDALPSALLAMPQAGRADAAIQALGAWHLLAEACRRQNLLPEALREDVRRLTGWSMQRQTLLDDKQALRKSGSWAVFAIHSEVQPDKLRRIETWLEDGEGGHALLMDFVPLATGAGGSPFAPGERFHAELVFYPSAAPMRAIIAARSEAPASSNAPPPQVPLREALDSCHAMRSRQPWLGAWPVSFTADAVVQTGKGELWVTDGDLAVPLDPRQRDETLVLTQVDLSAMTGFWNGASLNAASAETSLGKWLRL